MSKKIFTKTLRINEKDGDWESYNLSFCPDGICRFFKVPKRVTTLYLSVYKKKKKNTVKIKYRGPFSHVKVEGENIDFSNQVIYALEKLVDKYDQKTFWVGFDYGVLV